LQSSRAECLLRQGAELLCREVGLLQGRRQGRLLRPGQGLLQPGQDLLHRRPAVLQGRRRLLRQSRGLLRSPGTGYRDVLLSVGQVFRQVSQQTARVAAHPGSFARWILT
jgi:hypothetical protein